MRAPRPGYQWSSTADSTMSYPDPVYHGERGEASATFRRADADPDFVSPRGTRLHYLAPGATTRGRYGLYRYEMPPRSGGNTREASITQEKVEPRPGSLSITRRPWCRFSTCLTMDRPRPVPPDSRERLDDTR